MCRRLEMKEFQIFCDSSCDLPKELLDLRGIITVPFYVSFDGKNYGKEIQDFSIEDFYVKLSANTTLPKTSLPSTKDYMNHFKRAILNGMDVFCLCLSAKFSGSYQSALNAKSLLEEDFPEAKIIVINSIQASSAEGLTVLQAAYMKEAGLPIEKVKENICQIKYTSRIMLTLDNLDYLQKGDHIGKLSTFASSWLNLKPLIVLKDAELHPYGAIRGRKRSIEKIVQMVEEYFEEHEECFDNYEFGVATGCAFEDAGQLKELLENSIGFPISYPIFRIGSTIGTYISANALGVCFIKKYTAL